MNKTCTKCNIEKNLSEFYKDKKGKNGLSSHCKECLKNYQKEHRKVNPEKIAQTKKEYYQKNKDSIKLSHQEYYAIPKNKEKSTLYKKQWRKDNLEKVLNLNRKREKEKRKTDPAFKILQNLRTRTLLALKGELKSKRTVELLGCTIEFFQEYLKSQFKLGMTFENYGSVWQIDHIKPCCTFDLTIPEQQLECFNYKNTRPLWTNNKIAREFGDFETIGNLNRQKGINTAIEYIKENNVILSS